MEARQHGVVGKLSQLGRLAPLLGDAQQFVAGNGDDGAVTRVEVHLHLAVYHLEVLQVGGLGELVAAFHIDVVHQDVLVLPYQLEGSRAFDGIGGLLLVVGFFGPLSGGQRTGGGHFNAVAVALGLVEQVEHAILIHNVAIDARLAVLGQEEDFGFAFQVGEVVVGIGIVDDVRAACILHGPVNHVFSGFGVEDGLRRPYALQRLLAFVLLLHVDDGVGPVDQIVGLEHHHGAVGVPAVGRHHVGQNHVERFAVLAAQDVGIAHAARRTDDFGIEHRLAAVECPVRISVHADGIAYGFFTDVIARKISE